MLIYVTFAYAEDMTCRSKGRCICTESESPAQDLGYVGGASLEIHFVCINEDTMECVIYDDVQPIGMHTAIPVPH